MRKNLELRIKTLPAGRQDYELARGFTLIELIIVVVIIGILSTLVMANFVGIRGRIRDGQRKSDLNQIKTALEIYHNDYGLYPSSSEITFSNDQCGEQFAKDGITYMQKIPCDPINDQAFKYTYISSSDLSAFELIACLENINDAKKTDKVSKTQCDSLNNWSYTLTNP